MTLELKDCSFSYDGKSNIFENISFALHQNEIITVLGPNGAGKTTFLRCITMSLKKTKGTILINGVDTDKMTPKKFWHKISYVPQSKNILSSLEVTESVLLGLSGQLGIFSSPGEKDYEKADNILKMLGIEKLKNKCTNEISGGELQMVLIARALISEPELLILDEPESNLDFQNQLIVLDAISSLSQKNVACIFNTHYPAHALRYANKSLLLYDGKSQFGNSENIVTEENIKKAFGVNAVISDINTDSGVYKSVFPISLSAK